MPSVSQNSKANALTEIAFHQTKVVEPVRWFQERIQYTICSLTTSGTVQKLHRQQRRNGMVLDDLVKASSAAVFKKDIKDRSKDEGKCEICS